MKAIEFSGNIKEGSIKIPRRLLTSIGHESVRIIILVEEKEGRKKKLTLGKRFKAVKLDTRGFKFDRDEANER